MNIKEEMAYYTEHLTNIKKYRIYMTKIGVLEKRLRKYLKEEIKGNKNIQFTSQDLRSLIVKMEKIHKAMNKSINFIEMKNKYAKRGYIDEKTMKEDGRDLGLRIAHTIILQTQLAYFNHHATLCSLIEIQYDNEAKKRQQEIADGDKLFTDTMIEALMEMY